MMPLILNVDKPANVFNESEYEYGYHALECNGKTYGYVAYRQVGRKVELHLEILKWNVSQAKDLKESWHLLKFHLCSKGATELVVMNYKQNDGGKWLKLIKSLGFTDIVDVQYSVMEV